MSPGKLLPDVGADDHVLGNHDAPITLVEYGDFECPYCGAAYPVVHDIVDQLGANVRFAYRNFPLKEQHPHAEHAAEAAEAAAAQGKFWEMHDQLFEHQNALEDPDLARYAADVGADAGRVLRELKDGTNEPRVREHFMSGVRSGVNGTPTFFVNGKRFDGNWADAEEFVRALREMGSV